MAQELLEMIESMRSEEASVQRLFGDAGSRVRGRRNNPVYEMRVAETFEFLDAIHSGRLPVHYLREALTTSDFPLLFGDVIDRQMLGFYQETPYTWSNYVRRATVPDFRPVKRFAIDGAEAVLPVVVEEGPYTETKLTETKYQYSVTKHGKRVPFSWEAIINDDLDALKDVPARMGKAARRSEEKFATTLFCGVSGPDSTIYTVAHKNIVSYLNAGSPQFTAQNPPLSVQALAEALTVLANQTDTESEPISIDAVELVVPPALEVAAKLILNSTQLLVGSFGQSISGSALGNGLGTSQLAQMMTSNFLSNRIRLNVNSYIPIVASTANGSTSWWLFASPSVGRPALEMGFLRGHETPEIFQRSPNARRIGVGTEDPMNGSFDNDTIDYKVRHVFGGVAEDYRMTVASNGSGV